MASLGENPALSEAKEVMTNDALLPVGWARRDRSLR